MAKQTTFKWAYGTAELSIDKRMNRQRAARLIRIWRKDKSFTVKRHGKGFYSATVGGVVGFMKIC